MFSSSGYFKGVNCPYYASGLCERVYCHFRHVRNDAPSKRNAFIPDKTSFPCDLEPIKRNGSGEKSSLLGMVGNAIKQVQRDIEKDKAIIQHLQPNSKPLEKPGTALPSYKPTPLAKVSDKAVTQGKLTTQSAYLPPGIPAYRPTPIHLLQQKKKPSERTSLEYDPLSNSRLSSVPSCERVTLADAEQRSAVKRESDCPDFVLGKVIKKERKDSTEGDFEAKFSSDDESAPNKDDSNKNEISGTQATSEQSCNGDVRTEVDLEQIKKETLDSGTTYQDKTAEHCDKVPSKFVAKKEPKEASSGDSKPVDQQLSVTQDSTEIQNEKVYDESEEHKEKSKDDGIISDQKKCEEKKGSHVDKSKEITKEKDDDKSRKHRSSRSSNHQHKHSDRNDHRPKSSERSKDRRHRHGSHSSSSRHKHSASSRCRHISKRSKGSHHSKNDGHEGRDDERESKHRKSGRSHHNPRKSKHSYKHKKSGWHHRHHRHQSSSKASSSKRRHGHSPVSSDTSCYSSSSGFSSSDESTSVSSHSFSSSQSPEGSLTNSSVRRHKRKESSTSDVKSRSSSALSRHDRKMSTSLKASDSPSNADHLSSSGKQGETTADGVETANVFEKFRRTVSCVDLFGEDSSESEAVVQNETATSDKTSATSSKSAAMTGKPLVKSDTTSTTSGSTLTTSGKSSTTCGKTSQKSSDVIILSSDSLSDDDSEMLAIDTDIGDEESEKKVSGIKRKFDIEADDGQKMKTMKPTADCSLAEDGVPLIAKKRRLAHPANPDAIIKRKPPPLAPHRPTPAQIMMNRFKELQKAQGILGSESDASGSSTRHDGNDVSGKRRVAHAVHGPKPGSSLMKSKSGSGLVCGTGTHKKSDGMADQTTAGTVTKGANRRAHVPNQKTLQRPLITAQAGGKVATSIRQRYLNLFVDECLKIYPQAKDAYDRALLEEKSVSARASNKNIYLNVAVNTLKKLRDEVMKSSDGSDQEVKSPTKNPMTLSHAAILGGSKAANTPYTIRRSAAHNKLPSHLTSRQLYILLSRYILTEEQLIENSFPQPLPGQPGQAKLQLPERVKQMPTNSTEKVCVRCGKRFLVSVDGVYITQENCMYHWGRCWKRRIAGSLESRYTCCQGDTESKGCQLSEHHVHEQNKYKDLSGYVETQPISPPEDGDYKLFAMDCEMVYTLGGCELARVTVIDVNLQPVYEAIVKPENKVIDYNTRFSGLTADDMKGIDTQLSDVQAVLLSMFNDKTILIGHSLESDLIALKLLHKTVVDTSVVFPHKLGPPYKRALRTLMAEILHKIIQNDVGGHDSKEDAAACMELMIWKARDDAKKALRS